MNLTAHLITSATDPLFLRGHTALNNYFGARNEMESLQVLTQRLNWSHVTPQEEYQLLYEMLVILDDDNNLACAGDYSVIIHALSEQPVTVHLSHIWIDPAFRGKGIVQQHMNQSTLAAANRAIRLFNKPSSLPINLVGEMDPYLNGSQEATRRVKRFLLAGLKVVDPTRVHYYQPDFRPFAIIDQSGGAEGLELVLMAQRLGRESEEKISSAELKHTVNSLYAMYGKTSRPQDMAVVYKTLANYPANEVSIPLLSKI